MHSLPETSAGYIENIIDDIVVVFEEHKDRKEYIEDAHCSHLVCIVDKSVDVAHDLFGVGGHKVGEDQLLYLAIDTFKHGKCSKYPKHDRHERNDREERTPTETGSIMADLVIKEILEKVSEENIVVA